MKYNISTTTFVAKILKKNPAMFVHFKAEFNVENSFYFHDFQFCFASNLFHPFFLFSWILLQFLVFIETNEATPDSNIKGSRRSSSSNRTKPRRPSWHTEAAKSHRITFTQTIVHVYEHNTNTTKNAKNARSVQQWCDPIGKCVLLLLATLSLP